MKQPDIIGKKIDLRGSLDLRLQTFHLILVEEVMDRKVLKRKKQNDKIARKIATSLKNQINHYYTRGLRYKE